MRGALIVLLAAGLMFAAFGELSAQACGVWSGPYDTANGQSRIWCSGNTLYQYNCNTDTGQYNINYYAYPTCNDYYGCVWDQSTQAYAKVRSVCRTDTGTSCNLGLDQGATIVQYRSLYCGYSACAGVSCNAGTCSGTAYTGKHCEAVISGDTATGTCVSNSYSQQCGGVWCSGADAYTGVCTTSGCTSSKTTTNDPDCISPATSIISPTSDAVYSVAPTITWQSQSVTRYELLVSKTSAFASGDVMQTSSIISTQQQITGWEAYVEGSSYWFKVRTVKENSKGTTYSTYTTPIKFTKGYNNPTTPIISNMGGAIIYPFNVAWGVPSSGKTPYSYILEIDAQEHTINNALSFALPALASGNHTIRIKTKDAENRESPYSSIISFSISNNPSSPTTNNISGGSTLTYPFTIQIGAPAGGIPPHSYTLKIDSTEYAVPAGQAAYSLPNLAGGTNHTIQVKTKDAANQESSYSAPIQFQVTNNPAAPTITSHTQGQTVTGQQTIVWQAPTSGFPPFKYTVKINGVEVPNIVSTTYTPTLQGTVQSIQIKATDSAGMESPYSTSISFNVEAPNAPRIISPLEGATVSPNVTLRWEGTTGGVQPYSYKLRLCSDQSCNNVFALGAVNKLVDGEWKYTTPTLPEGQWRIELYAVDANNIGSPLAVRYLSVVTVKTSQILKPISNSETTQTPRIEWSQATGGAGGYIYTLRILKGTSWASTKVYEIRIDGLSHTVPSGKLVNGEYYYAMVKAEDKDGFESVVSEPRGFYVTKTAPTINRPLITAPGATGLSIVGNQPTSISWEGIGQNAVYTMEVARDILFSDILYSVTTTSLFKDIPVNSITTNGKFYVRVRAKVGEEYSQWSIPREIEYRLSLAPTLECTPACKTGEVCTNGVCVTPPAVVNEVRGALVEVPKELKQGGAYYIRANLRSTTAATQDKYTVKIYNGATTLYASTFDMAVTPQGDNKGITIDIPADLDVPAGTYTIQVTDSKGTVVASAEVPYKSSSNPLEGIIGGDLTTIAIVAGCAGIALAGIWVLRQKPKKIKAALRPIKKQFTKQKPKRKKQKKLNTIKVNKRQGARR